MSRIAEIETLTLPDINVVVMRTNDGLEGIGQTGAFHGPIVADVLHKLIAPDFLGAQIDQHADLLKSCETKHYKFIGPFFARALAGMDTALWDLRAKAEGVPVHGLIGSQMRDRVPVYGSSMRRQTTVDQEIAALKSAIGQFGLQHVKFKIGTRMGDDDPNGLKRAKVLVDAVRSALPDIGLRADGNGAFGPDVAIGLGRRMQDLDYVFLEEPCPHTDLTATRRVNQALAMPIAGGEVDHRLETFTHVITEGVVDIVQPDICNGGGFSRALAIADLAEAHKIPCTPHCAQQSLVQVFTLHLAAVHSALWQPQEYRITDNRPWAKSIYQPLPEPVEGHLTVPTGSGWGVTLTAEFLKQAKQCLSKITDPTPLKKRHV